MAKAIKVASIVVGVAALAVFTAGAGLALATGASLAGSVGAVGAAIGVSAGTLAAVGAGLSVAAGLMQRGPSVPSSQEDRLTATINPRAPRATVYGQTAMATDVRYEEWSGADQDYCDWVIALASHRIDGVEEIWLNTELAWSASRGVTSKFVGYFSVPNIVLEGSPANAFTFASGKWNGRLTGCAYLRARFKVTGNGKKATSPFSSGVPTRITIIGRGMRLYDPRRDSTVPGGNGPMRADDQSTWRYTADDGAVIGENLALHALADTLGWRIRNPSTGEMKLAVGSGVPARRLNLASWIEAANLCDEAVNRSAGGTEPRYHGAVVLSEAMAPKERLDTLCVACNGRFRDTGGKLSFVISHNDLATAALDDGLLDDDVVGPFTWTPDAALDAVPNVVRGKYVDATTASLYQMLDYPDVRLPSLDGQDREFTLDLAAVESPSQAQRIAKQVLQRKQYQREFTAPFDIRAWKYGVGDIVPFTFAPLSFERKLFRVKEQEIGQGGTCNMTLTVESPDIYAWDRDDSAPVQPAEANAYDASKNPLILAIDDAATTAHWSAVADDDGKRPDDNATNSADPNSPFGNGTVGEAAAQLDRIAEIDPIKTDVSALQEARIEHDEALDALGRVDDAQAAALEKLKGDTGRSLVALETAGVRRDAAQRDADAALGRVSEATLRALVEADRTRAVLRDAGVVVDPVTGQVRIYAIDQVADRTSAVEVKLDAQANTIRSKASVDFVQEQIALAVLDPSQVAELEPLIRRMTAAETLLDGLRATVELKAEATELGEAVARLSSVSQTLDALAGTVSTKADRTDLEDQALRLTNAEQTLAALPNGASIIVTLRQVGAGVDTAGEAALRGLLASDQASRARIKEVAEYREEAITRIDSGLAAESLARRDLSASMGALDARLTDQLRTLVTTTGVQAERVAALGVSSDKQAAAIGELQEASIDAAGGNARAERTIRQVAGVADANADATLRALIAGDASARAARAQLVQVHEEATTRLVAGELSLSQTKLLLEAQLGTARALIGSTEETLARADRAAATRMDAMDVKFGQVDGEITATQARVTREVSALAEADAAQVRDLHAVSLELRDPDTGLAQTRALTVREAKESLARDKAMSETLDAVGVTAGDAAAAVGELREVSATQAGGLTRLATTMRQAIGQADDGSEATLRALIAGDQSGRERQRQIVQIQTELSTQLVAGEQVSAVARQALTARMNQAEGAIVSLNKVVAALDSATASRLDAVEVQFATQAREIASTVGRIAREEEARAAGDAAEALARETLQAQVNGVASDVVLAKADIGEERRVRAEADRAEAEARSAIGSQLNDPSTGLPWARSAIADLARVTNDRDASLAESIRQVRAYLDGIGNVGLQEAFEAVVNRLGKVEGRWSIVIDADGNLSGIQLIGSSAGPASFNLINTDLKMGTGRVVFNNGKFMQVQGVGFGVAKDLIDWFGPTMALDQCSRANAISYRATDGAQYTGGSFSAGTLRNGSASSSLAADAVAEVPSFGSNGKPVKYIASWSYYSEYTRDFAADSDGLKLFQDAAAAFGATSDDGGYVWFGTKNVERVNSTITLSRAFASAAYQQLEERGFTTEQTTFRGLKPTPGDAPGRATYTESIGGGFTVLDPTQSTANRALKLALSRGFNLSEGVIQRLTIVAIEE